MGYTTDFRGHLNLEPPLTVAQTAYLRKFNETRRVQRDAAMTEIRPDPLRVAVGLPVGRDGGYFVGESGFMGQAHGHGVRDSNRPPTGQPGLWCQWTPSDDGARLEWDGGEKFYDYVEWLEYLIQHFLQPWGVVANGTIDWEGEESSDRGRIQVDDNQVSVGVARVTYEF